MKRRKSKNVSKLPSPLPAEVRAWALKVGVVQATIDLLRAGASPTTADKLARGDYHSNPGPLLTKTIKEAMGEVSITESFY